VPATPESLLRALGALPVVVEAAWAAVEAVAVPSYPDEPRPHSVVRLAGAGAVGCGEHVGWTLAAHEACRERTLPRTAMTNSLRRE